MPTCLGKQRMVHGHFFAKVSDFVTDGVGPSQEFPRILKWPLPESARSNGGICKFARNPGKRCRNGKNDYKQVDMRSHSMIVAIRYNFGPGGNCARDLWI